MMNGTRHPHSPICCSVRKVPRRVLTALALRGVLDEEGGGAADFAAGRKALQHAAADDEQRGAHANGGVGRGSRDQQRADGHQHDGQGQRGFAAGAVAIRAQHQRTQWPNHEAQPERQERGHQLHGRVFVVEEVLPDVHREQGVDREVIPLQRVACRCRDDGLAAAALLRGGLGSGVARHGPDSRIDNYVFHCIPH
ncbi:hypothetical protein G6F57_018590 [Rhizopus arrhizus]|nr:hypothetical protein G6F57_018590 [Rhizopus arrhizus]